MIHLKIAICVVVLGYAFAALRIAMQYQGVVFVTAVAVIEITLITLLSFFLINSYIYLKSWWSS